MRRSLIRAVALTGATILLAGCLNQSSSSVLTFSGRKPPLVSAGVAATRPGQPVIWGSMMLCVSKAGTARITSVQPVKPIGGLEVDDFSVRPNPLLHNSSLIADARGSLKQNDFVGSRAVTTSCGSPRSGKAVELAVQASRPTDADAASESWLINYTIDGQSKSLTYPMAVRICGERSPTAPACRKLSPFSQ
jgi:hypothetical protein